MKGKVNLLIIGAQKAGTTSLFHYLNQHPDIYFSEVKEVNYFSNNEYYKRGEKYYHSFFSKHKNQKIIASSYVHMLPDSNCPARVKEYNPDMKFIVMLRNPIKRAESAYNYAIRNHWEEDSVSFMDAFNIEKERLNRVNPNYDITYFYNGLYYKHISNWLNYFPRKNFIFFKDTDLRVNSKQVLDSIFDFLNIERNVTIDTSKNYNEAAEVRSLFFQGLFTKGNPVIIKTLRALLPRPAKLFVLTKFLPYLRKLNTKKSIKLDKTNNNLINYNQDPIIDYFKEDSEKLQQFLNIKLL